MRNTLVIARRELGGYFNSPIAYIVIVAFLVIAGWMVFSSVFLVGRADLRTFFQPFSPVMFLAPGMLLIVLAPAITMRLVAEERKSGTIELLTTMPVRDSEVLVGKFLAALGLLAVALGLTLLYPITISFVGPLDWGPVISGYVGMLLFAGSLLAVGLLCSTLTDNQIVAFILAAVVCAALYFMLLLRFFLPEWLGRVVELVSVSGHLDNLARGVIDTRDILYYLTLTVGALFLAERSLARQHA